MERWPLLHLASMVDNRSISVYSKVSTTVWYLSWTLIYQVLGWLCFFPPLPLVIDLLQCLAVCRTKYFMIGVPMIVTRLNCVVTA